MIFIYEDEAVTLVYDLDSELPFPCSFDTYVNEALPQDDLLKPEFQRYSMCRNKMPCSVSPLCMLKKLF